LEFLIIRERLLALFNSKAQLSLLGKINTDDTDKEFTWSDKEIYLFLPEEIRITKTNMQKHS